MEKDIKQQVKILLNIENNVVKKMSLEVLFDIAEYLEIDIKDLL